MKQMIVIIVVGLLVGLGGLSVKNTFDFGKETFIRQTVEVEKEVVVDTLDKLIKDAQEAKSDVIRATGETAKKDAETRMLEAIELEVREAYGKDLDAKELELKKKQTSY